MKASMHSGRKGSAKHNDRSFLQGKSKEQQEEIAPHIDLDRTGQNRMWVTGIGWTKEADIEDAERKAYARLFGKSQEAKNERYRAQRHPERCKTTDDLYEGRLTRPEEVILQVGSAEHPVSPEVFDSCLKDYIARLNEWNDAHGGRMKWLSIACHYDETSPHAHIRRTWAYRGRDGRALGQDKALEAAGVPLPDPGKQKGRYNNRKMSFDAQMRGIWLDICEEHGLDIDREPVPGMRHKEKADFIREKLGDEIEELHTKVLEAEQEAEQSAEYARRSREAEEEARRQHREAYDQLKKTQEKLRMCRRELEESMDRAEALKQSVKLLSRAEVAELPAGLKKPFFGLLGGNQVIIDRGTLNKLVETAEVAEIAMRETVTMRGEQRRAIQEARKAGRAEALEQAKKEAKAITDRAMGEAEDIISLIRERDYYRGLASRYPELFERMKGLEQERISRRKGRSKGVER